ncbi:DUF4198 domain-containing protein [Bythopirellula polymerisocia]|uniref:Carboxypeptidase regulatory-like domain-containing protein n=1 Tax=Bythopirellula polymerisocia TaxID=2528003 RepID=A0A5C6CF26_9BACT|nr:DUF4198 domain-containing protein [Bythopirellula polymerisocia]TWU22712.1 hypothetical protein Pla144_41730 [Bythopirellula polymerisocia]
MFENLRPITRLLTLLALGVQLGCSNTPYELVSVSGVVTLNGEPLSDATVSFEPNGAGKELVGPGSMGTTDEQGAYELETYKNESGAVVGFHTVRISTFKSEFKDFKNSDDLEIVSKERVPWQYNLNTQLTFEVPTEGTEGANFELTGEAPQLNNRLGRRRK